MHTKCLSKNLKEKKKQLADQDGGWDDNIKMDLKERSWEDVNWTYLDQN